MALPLGFFKVCYFFSDCSTLDQSCSTCISGEKRCDVVPGGEGKRTFNNYLMQRRGGGGVDPASNVANIVKQLAMWVKK